MIPLIAPSFDLTVITVVRNDAKGLRHTIDSIKAEKKSFGLKMEHIVIDGASTDSTLDVMRHNQDDSAHWVSEPDDGIYDAMNKGLALSSGTWVYFLNAGDLLRTGTLNAMHEALTVYANAHQGRLPDVITGLVNVVNPQYEDMGYTHPSRPMTLMDLSHGNCVAHQATWISRHVFEMHGAFRTDLRIMGDYEYWIRLRRAGCELHWVPIVVADFVRNGLSSARGGVLLAEKERLEILVRAGDLPVWRAVWSLGCFSFVFHIKSLLRWLLGERLSQWLSLRKLRRGK